MGGTGTGTLAFWTGFTGWTGFRSGKTSPQRAQRTQRGNRAEEVNYEMREWHEWGSAGRDASPRRPGSVVDAPAGRVGSGRGFDRMNGMDRIQNKRLHHRVHSGEPGGRV